MSLSHIFQQEEHSRITAHEQLAVTYCDGEMVSFGCGDIRILHNISILLKALTESKRFGEELKKTITRFHITVSTMCCSPNWDWVKPDHITPILKFLDETYEYLDTFVRMFKAGQDFFTDKLKKSVEAGLLLEGDYLQMENVMKSTYKFITDSEFKRWVGGRSDFYKTLDGKTLKVKVIQLPEINQDDGKALLITA